MSESCQLDHIVMAARTVAEGVEYFREISGIEIPAGGFHPMMGTHNHLMQIGNNAFFEVIAVNPAAEWPERPRWYALDDPLMQNSLTTPRLITWVVSTPNMARALQHVNYETGPALAVTRGNLSWLLTIPGDGAMPNGGLLPSVIQWHDPGSPCSSMPDLGCRLRKISIYHPYPDWYRSCLSSIDALDLIELLPAKNNTQGYIEITLETPAGLIFLNSNPW
jgi:hypothetical protein